MRTTLWMGLAVGLLVALAPGCGSSKDTTGSAGTTGAAGTSGAAGTIGDAGTNGAAGATGDAGTTGSAGATGDAGTPFSGSPDAGAPYAMACGATVKNKATCMTATDVQCANTCGPNKVGYKNCNCYTDVWDCPRCEYAPGDYSCYALPDPVPACPPDPTDPNGTNLITVGTACTVPKCMPCGSATLVTYRDSMGSAKAGFCVCGDEGKWTCASMSEWPGAQR